MQEKFQQHEAFKSYLFEKYGNKNARVDLIYSFIESDLVSFLNDSFGTEFDSIFDISESQIVDNLREAIISNPVLHSIDRNLEDITYTEALNVFRNYLCSPYNSSRKSSGREIVTKKETLLPNESKNEQPFDDTEITPGNRIHHEGAEVQLDHVTTHERNKEARKECIDYYKSLHNGHIVCECCGFDFSKAYSEIGDDFIEVHHLHPVSQRGGDYVVNPKIDLVPLCSNCHSMIHRIGGQGDCMSLEDLKVRYIGKLYIND